MDAIMSLTDFLSSTDAPIAVRKPQAKVAFGAAAPSGLAVDIPLLSPAADPWTRSLVSVVSRCALAPHVDITLLQTASDTQAPAVALDDTGSIDLGYQDEGTHPVMHGHIHQLSLTTHHATTVTVANGGALLSQLRLNQSYEQQTAGDLVADLCNQAGVALGTVESGIDYPFYVIDDRINAFQHIHRLARHCGYLAYFDTTGALYFGPAQAGAAVQSFSYHNDILRLSVRQSAGASAAVTVTGAGAAGAQGQDAWSWLVKDPAGVTASAGNGRARRYRAPALRSVDAVQACAAGLANACSALALRGEIVTPGAPLVVVGSRIAISEAPGAEMNGEFLVTQVSHTYTKAAGFISVIQFTQSASSGSALLGGLL
ncbi:phage late control D family protein [Teredinibacter turnerae]|uniref:phage late control D family protein n=1 Tax=Teredinibacter turnerae TaxID=2426 RepID=UPI0003631F0B|nr:contractile injection system protein, VgrG/Pvc8 family [Teredinibacter turnerae]